MTHRAPTTVVVLATGGTISSRADRRGAHVATDGADELLRRIPASHRTRVRARDVMTVGSYTLTLPQMHDIVQAAHEALDTPNVTGVVVTHGTDSLEETASLADLCHRDPRPVVFTGAQQPADHPGTDGPRNLADAIATAADPTSRDRGALIVFDGAVHAAFGTRKTHTTAPGAFTSPDHGPIGTVVSTRPSYDRSARRVVQPFDSTSLDFSDVRVDIVATYPGADAVTLRAAAAAGARGVVLEALGTGNANPVIAAEVRRLTEAGLVIALTTRVDSGPVRALYGAGGGRDLVAAGALPTGLLRGPQTRILLAALLARYSAPARVRTEVAHHMAEINLSIGEPTR